MIWDGHGIGNLRVSISQACELASELVICPSAHGRRSLERLEGTN